MRFAGLRRLPAGLTTVLGDIILRLTLMSVMFTTAVLIFEVVSGLYQGAPRLIDF
jgi:hypothetical protein